jgi:uncharacterized protein
VIAKGLFPARSARHAAPFRRHGFLCLALLVGPICGWALHMASRLGMVEVPRVSLGWAALAASLVLAPVLEELVFRGGIQSWLDGTSPGRREVARGLTVGNLSTSVLFAAAHLAVLPPWLAASIFFPSLVFGRLKQLYPSLLPAMLVHAWFNACYLATGSAWPSLAG